ncbi:penicillin-binding protein 1A [Arenibacter palladensis]|uniref:penicillin-binding protein 1A n=1 Tax=Arenibacter palladensis TaxID=237373 RepID=UPI0026E2F34F|nr:transglycosylase domain-containing protein [Arenibacter palladensis]MDO6605426.1 transglycosylase domain-containing protein [Arenibacter palladensis]
MLKNIKNPFLRIGIISLVVIGGTALLLVLSIYLGAWGKLPSKQELSDFKYQRASEVYSADSVLIGKYFLFDRQPIQYEEVPKNLIEALVAIEDERFYDHSGIDYKSLFRVAFKTILMQDQSAGGGSTISQQLAKNLYPREKSGKFNLAISKFKEMIIASRLEAMYSKEDILMLYLNTVSFGDNTFGIESASLKFFNKSARELELQESATLVGMLKATYGYNPRVFPKNSLNRRNLVIQSMYSNDFLSQKEADSLKLLPLQLNYRDYDYSEGIAPYFREEVRKQMLNWAKEQREKGLDYNIYTSGLKIYTTLDSKMQMLAEEAMGQHMKALQNSFEKSYGKRAPWIKDQNLIKKVIQNSGPYKKWKKSGLNEKEIMDSMNLKKEMLLRDWNQDEMRSASTIDSLLHYLKFLNTGSLSLDPKTGAVKTWLGGISFKHFKYDHISQSKRQVGSAFKPIVYTAALEKGIAPCTYFSAQEVAYENMEGWSPSNSGNKDEAYLNYSMEEALSKSVNTVAVKVLEKTGIPNVIDQAQKMGIETTLPALPSLALGTAEIKINDLAGAYASYLNHGKSVTPFLIHRITNEKDSIIETFKPVVAEKRAFSEETGQIMLEMMKATVNSGTAARIRSTYGIKNDIAGKTGTTQNNKDAWFVALTPKLLNITWVGLDNHEIGFSSTSLGQGANAALPIFALWLQKLNADKSFDHITKAKFPNPSSAVMSNLDCDPVKRDGFFKRLFKNPKKKKTKDFKSGNTKT